MKIANIVTDSKISVSEEFNVVDSLGKTIQGIPTLIVGFDIVNQNFPEFDILSISLGDNMFWTFKRTEKRDKFEEDLKWFIKFVYNELIKDIPYIFLDPIQDTIKKTCKIVRKILSLKDPVSYVNGDMVYIYGENLIFGVDLNLINYLGLDKDKIKNKIKDKSLVFLDDDNILIEYKQTVVALGNRVRYIPYLFTIRHEQNNTTSIIHIQ
jgi:hypothetical protein